MLPVPAGDTMVGSFEAARRKFASFRRPYTVFNFRKLEQGMAFYTECCGVGPGDEYKAFRASMTNSEWEPTSAGWMPTLLDKCQGDHRAAIRLYLDLAAEFTGARSTEQAGLRSP